jgi:hypothetical protein
MYDALNKGMRGGREIDECSLMNDGREKGGEIDECSLMNDGREKGGEIDECSLMNDGKGEMGAVDKSKRDGMNRKTGGQLRSGDLSPINHQSSIINSPSSLLAWLNCDEQYLPGTLARVAQAALSHPEVALFSGGALLVDPEGALIAFRKAYPLRKAYIESDHLYNLSCGLFFRASAWQAVGGFDASLRDAADMDFVARLLRQGYRARCLPGYAAAFFLTGQNMSRGENAAREYRLLHRRAPAWTRTLRAPLKWARRCEKWMRGVYREAWPLEYALYLGDDLEERKRIVAEGGSARWPG